jgi:hypothetical protein
VDLSAYYGREMTPELLKEATEVIMAAITRLLEELRGEKAPEKRYDPREVRLEQRRRTAAATSRRQTARQEPGQPDAPRPEQEEQAQQEGQGT